MKSRALFRHFAFLHITTLLAIAGCTNSSDPRDEVPTEESVSARSFRMILPAKITPESEVWEQVAQIQAGNAHLPTLVSRPKPDEPASKQAELIRQVDDASAILLVEPQDPQAIASALEEVRAKGVTIVLLDRPVPVSGKPIPVVEFARLEKPVRAMVNEVNRVAKQLGAPPTGPAQIFVPAGTLDARSTERLNVLKQQLKEVGVTVLPDIPVGPDDSLNTMFKQALLAKPRPNLVFGLADQLVKPMALAWGYEEVGKLPVVAGYIADKANTNSINFEGCVAVVDLNIRALARVAVETALSLADGKPVPDRIEVPIEVRISDKGERQPSLLVRPEQ